MSDAPPAPSWRILLTPRWLSWHLFAVAAVAGMLWLGDWQFRRAMAGNTLSWAYTFEWPIFAIFGVVFWIKTVRDELHPAADGTTAAPVDLPPGSYTGPDGQAAGRKEAGQDEEPDQELAEYNAYLAKLSNEVKGHGRWHGLR
ncbi:MAG TPA: hypothetical protein VF843_18340 [Streptosporangiaceae bacterium]